MTEDMEAGPLKLWLVGATGRLGEQVALEAARAGWEIAITARNQDRLEDLAVKVRAAGGYCVLAPGDMTREGLVNSTAEALDELLEGLDALVTMIRVDQESPLLTELSTDRFNRSLAVGVRGPFLCTLAASRLMKDGGSIVHVVGPEEGVDGVCREALIRLTRTFSEELAHLGILINAIDPSPVGDSSIGAILELASLGAGGATGMVFSVGEDDGEVG